MRRSDYVFVGLGAILLALAPVVVPPAPDPPSGPRGVVQSLALPEFLSRGMLTSGETLTDLLARVGVPAREVGQWVETARAHLNLRSLPVGLTAEARADHHGVCRAVRITPDWSTSVVLERSGERLEARREKLPVERELVTVQGEVRTSLFEAVLATGESEEVALELAEVFQWDVDFHREVRRGDRFALLVERVRAEGRTVAYGPLVAATYLNAGKRLTAVRYQATGADPGYYDASARPLRKQFIRAPLRFSRVTSRFSRSRLHPVLGKRLPHWGVDYGAPAGTPVMATAAGTVSYRGWKGGGGNTLEIRHAGGFITAYLHLQRFASGVSTGTKVRQGEVIGYVGSTGLSTGPHLDYRIQRSGRYVNPMSIGNDPAPPLGASELPRFSSWAELALGSLAGAELEAGQVAALRAAAPVRLDG